MTPERDKTWTRNKWTMLYEKTVIKGQFNKEIQENLTHNDIIMSSLIKGLQCKKTNNLTFSFQWIDLCVVRCTTGFIHGKLTDGPTLKTIQTKRDLKL